MGIIQELRYEVPQPNGAQRAVWRVTSSRAGAWAFARTAHHLDRLVLARSQGRVALATLVAGIPVITVATTGARTGRSRSTPLLGVPAGDDIAVIGTRFGQHGTPGWYHNMCAHPEVTVSYRASSVRATAREAQAGEWQSIWRHACQVYPGYQVYARRIRDREIHIMVLAGEAGAP